MLNKQAIIKLENKQILSNLSDVALRYRAVTKLIIVLTGDVAVKRKFLLLLNCWNKDDYESQIHKAHCFHGKISLA